MILTREINIKITESNYQYYEDMGYDVSIGEFITIPIELISKGSHHKITCKCDKCDVEKEVIYKNYNSSYSFNENSIVLLNQKNKLLGTRIFGALPKKLRYTKFSKLITLSSGLLN
jgi:ribosomal protein L14